jgi:hypothetical protein
MRLTGFRVIHATYRQRRLEQPFKHRIILEVGVHQRNAYATFARLYHSPALGDKRMVAGHVNHPRIVILNIFLRL